MRKLVNNRELSDVTFIVDGFPVYASRVHLALRSEHFRAMLYGGMRESEKGAEIEIKVRCVGLMRLLQITCEGLLSTRGREGSTWNPACYESQAVRGHARKRDIWAEIRKQGCT